MRDTSSATPPFTVTILGAGAMGAAFASAFYAVHPACVRFVADAERARRLAESGLIVNGQHYRFTALGPDDPVQPADLVLVAVKQHHLEDALPALARHIGPQTLILSVMNGLDSEPMIGAMYGPEKVLLAMSVGIDAQRHGNEVRFGKLGKIVFGEPDNTTLSERVRRVQPILDRAGIPYETPQDMVRMMWWKLMINVGVNQTSALLGVTYHIMQTDRDAQAIMEAAMREVIAVAQAEGVNLTEQDIANWYPVLNTLLPEGKTSMAQDVAAGRKTEVEIFAGKIIALGEKHSIPTPVNRMLFHAIRVLERLSGSA
ncbi:MAG: 2-dehydropantoate 2-reductase [Anaerolineae bacterium]